MRINNQWRLAKRATCVGIAMMFGTPAFAADVEAGRTYFRQQCTVCHTAEANDNGGAQGPALSNVFGQPAASTSSFGYTQALRDSKLVWDTATLNRFLESPTTVVPGSAMVVPVINASDRNNVIAYLQSIKGTASTVAAAMPAAIGPVGIDTADWRKDKPGRMHRIDVDKLPKPFDTPSVRNSPKAIDRPPGAELSVPKGFKVDVYATQLLGPRRMVEAANGQLLVTETRGGRVSLLQPAKDGKSATSTVYVEGLKQPFGIALYPNAAKPQWLYVAETHRIIRYAYRTGDSKPRSEAEVVVASLPAGRGHFTRDLVFSADGKRMYVSVGSASNVAEDLPKKSVVDAQAWEAEHGLGATWDYETDRAAVLEYEVGSNKPGKTFATGIRNCVSLALQPKTHDLWCTTNERDLLGDDLVPDYSTRVKKGGFYGWPWYYLGNHEDPRLQGDRPDLMGKVTMPDVLYQAHSAPLNLTFYSATKGDAAFPADYVGDAFVAFHGSWNRIFRTGYKIVRVHMKQGIATGEYEDFMTGFIVDDGNVWGRPVATTVLHDGSLLVSDDGANQIYRVYYQR